MSDRRLVLVVDELDAVPRHDRMLLAELIKQLSDSHAHIKLVVVGIASSTADLLAGHPSVHRHQKEVQLERMSSKELTELVAGNATESKLSFHPSVVADIVNLSDGYPYFEQLLGLKCAETAVGSRSRAVFPATLKVALQLAVSDAEATLRRVYTTAIRSQQTEIYAHIVHALATFDDVEVPAPKLRAAVSELANRSVLQGELNNAMQRLMPHDENGILERVSRGVYRFSDPRMKVYVRLVLRAQT